MGQKVSRLSSPTAHVASNLSDLEPPTKVAEKVPEKPKSKFDPPPTPTPDECKEKFKVYLKELGEYVGFFTNNPTYRESARTKLMRLTLIQLYELSTDTYDELIRRKSKKQSFLPATDGFDPRRNQARQKLSTLPESRFQDLAGDVRHEISRRYPQLEGEKLLNV
ncbi:hypothetical protein BDN72DRAFT_837881 [Pluteus cervinus]|uniref:Uncharacterized protein n=1 Tax=Pluteus cervinus TaxID=181527 RepID=A0ACD3B141_9AGAR|nr:hypothetical protein BDN72DRAFT_837881 [Pluteus cervinus]